MSVHYRFKSALDYDTITFDGLHISVKDLKNAIIQQKRIGKSTDFDLQVTNAQSKEVYDDENALIPKNTSLLIARVPVSIPKTKQWDGYGGSDTPPTKLDDGGPILKAVDLSNLDAPEDDKIKAMMSQSTQDYDPSNYLKIRGANQMGPVPPQYRCYKCHQGGHWIKDCTLGQAGESMEIKKSTGIPQSFMVPVEGPHIQGAMMTTNGQYAVPVMDQQAYNQKNPNPAPFDSKPEIPEDLICSICSDLLTDAVMIPCCGNSFCDECIRSVLLESEEHECPDCHEKDISPGTLIPNRFLRKSVANFKNTTGYEKKPIYREKTEVPKTVLPKKEVSPPPQVDSTEKDRVKSEEEKTVISEADSTEQAKHESDDPESGLKRKNSVETDSISEGPPGVSPSRMSPKQHIKSKITNSSRDSPRERSSRHKYREDSPRKHSSHRHKKSPTYTDSGLSEDRQGTPTRDEPPGVGGPTNYPGPPTAAPFNPSSNPSMMAVGGPPLQGPPANLPPGTFPPGQPAVFPPNQAPPPNFRLPPPGAVAPPFMPPGVFPVPSRPMFDQRPPLSGPPPGFSGFSGPRPHSRDFASRRMGDRTPAGVIDDPLAAFNRMLRLKDERDRRKRNLRRSYSRSRSRSRSFSPSPRRRSRSPRRRLSRSRSRSPFSISRSRSRSYSLSPRGSPYRPLSPASRRSPLPPLRNKGPPRYRSPPRSPPLRRHPEPRGRSSRERDFGRDRDYPRDDRPSFRDKDRRGEDRDRDTRDVRDRDRDRDRGERFYDSFEDRRGRGPPPVPAQPPWNPPPRQDQGYYPPVADVQPGYQNRFPPRDYGPPPHMQPPMRRYDDIGPPGVEQPPVPGLEPEQPLRFEKLPEHRPPPGGNRDKPPPGNSPPPYRDSNKDREDDNRDRDRSGRRKRSRSPEKWRNPSPKDDERRKKDESPDKHKRRRRHSSSSPEDKRRDKERDRDRDKDHSDDEKKKSKEKKKHKEKKESDKKKKRDKKDKHKKSDKDKDKKDKSKDEFKQVIPRSEYDEGEGEGKKPLTEEEEIDKKRLREEREKEIDERRKKREVEEKNREEKKLEEERKKEERRLRFLEDEKKRKFDEEAKKKEEEERLRCVRELEEKQLIKMEPHHQELYEEQELTTEEISTEVIETYGNIETVVEDENDLLQPTFTSKEVEEGEVGDETEVSVKEFEEEEGGILELHTTDMDLKTELDRSDILAPVPEKSKWEEDEDGQLQSSPSDSKDKSDSKSLNKVTTEVLKRAENAIFAKAINAIRPIEIKKISSDRAKLYSDEKLEKVVDEPPTKKAESAGEKPRLSVKERLGIKVDDPDRVVLIEPRHKSRTISPFSRKERRADHDDLRRHERLIRRSRSRRRENSRERRRPPGDRRTDRRRRSDHKDRKEGRGKHSDDKKKKRSRSRSDNSEERKEKKRKREKRAKKDKEKKKEDDKETTSKTEDDPQKPTSATIKRKATLDEANFEPDYDLELHTDEATSETDDKKDKETAKKDAEDSSSSYSSSSSSEEERKKKKHKKHRKKKKKIESSSDSSDSSSDSSDSERERKRRKHKKSKKKKKKSKHK